MLAVFNAIALAHFQVVPDPVFVLLTPGKVACSRVNAQ